MLVAATPLPLPALIDRAVSTLASAKSAAEVLEAKEIAGLAYDIAKKTARLAKAKQAADQVIKAALYAQADAMSVEAQAKRRLADEYDAAQSRGEVKPVGNPNCSDAEQLPSTAALGLSRKDIHEGREIRDAEEADPGIVRRTLTEAVEAGEEPTRAKVKRAVKAKSKRTRHPRRNLNSPAETQHDRDLRALLGIWEAACESARAEFLTIVSEEG